MDNAARLRLIPLVDLRAQYLAIRNEIDAAIATVIRDAAFIGGPYLRAFEDEFAAYCGTQYAIGVSNGTDALRLALLACGIRPGDEVITVPNTFIATTEAISMVGAKIRFVDVDLVTFTMDPKLLASAITPRTRAIIPVHLYGAPADMDPILALAKQHDVKVIGDAAQAHGAFYRGRNIGALGDAVCFSFYPGKNLGAYGDAGAVVTNNSVIAVQVSMLRDHGREAKYQHDIEGFNCRMDGLQAAILSVKLRHLEEWVQRRRENAAFYDRLLAGTPGLTLPSNETDIRAVYHLYVIRTKNRSRLQEYLKANGIDTGIHYPIPLHLQPAYKHLRLPVGSFPISEAHALEILSLPLYPELTAEEIQLVADTVRAGIQKFS